MLTRPAGSLGLWCLLAAIGCLNWLPAAEDKDSHSSVQSWTVASPWSEVWMRVWVAEFTTPPGTSEKWEDIARPSGREDDMTLEGVLTRDQMIHVISALKKGHGVVLREVPPRLVLGSLKSMDVPVEALGKGVKVRFTPTLGAGGFDLDMKISYPSVGIHGTGKPLEMQQSMWDGQSIAMDQVISRQGGVAHHVYLLASAEILESSTKTRQQGAETLFAPSKKALSEIMTRVKFPEFVLHNASLAGALNELESQYLGALMRDRTLIGNEIVIAIRPTVAASTTAQISLDLRDVTMGDALRYVTELAGVSWKPEGNAVIVGALSTEEGMEMLTRNYEAPADFSERLDHAAAKHSVRDVLSAHGVAFPEGAVAEVDRKTGQLSVKATTPNLRIVESLVERAWNEPVGSDLHQARWLVIPKIDFQDVSLEDALDSIAKESRAADPEKRGAKTTVAPGCHRDRRLTLSVEHVSVLEAYFYAAKLTGHQVTLKKGSIIIGPESKP